MRVAGVDFERELAAASFLVFFGVNWGAQARSGSLEASSAYLLPGLLWSVSFIF